MRPSAYTQTSQRLLNVGFIVALAAAALGLLSLAVPAIRPPWFVGLLILGLGCVVGSEVLHVRTLEQYRAGSGYSLTTFYTLVMRRWFRGARSSPPLILAAVISVVAVVSSLWLPPGPAVVVSGGAAALMLIFLAIGRLLRW